MAEQQITQGALQAIFNDHHTAAQQYPVPVLQCLQIKTLETKGGAGSERYRIVLSDIRNYVQCMLATQANGVVHDGRLQRGCIVRMKSYQPQALKGKNVLIVLDLEVLDSLGTPDKIGDPQAVVEGGIAAAPAPAIGAGFYGAPAPAVKAETTQETKSQVQRQLASRPSASGRAGGGGGGGGPGGQAGTIYPIEALSPYAHKWTIKARVTHKSDIKTWHKASGEGKLFSVNLLDESSEIKATAFNQEVDQYYDLLQEGSVYYISSPCRVQLAKKQWSNLPNDYELTFERDTVIEKAEDQSSVPQVRYNFCNIQELQSVEKDATVDVIGVLKEVQEVTQIISKTTSKPYDKRELTLVDDTGYSVRVTIWGKTATEFEGMPESIVAFKGTRVGDFGGRSLSLLSSGTMSVNPDIPEAHHLKGWYDSTGKNNTFATHSNLASTGAASGVQHEVKTIHQVKEETMGLEDQTYFTVKATIVHIKQDPFSYPACRNEGCNKKVMDMNDGTWRCEKCNVAHDRPQHRYIMSLNVNDHTGQMWLSCFDDMGKVILGGKSADEMNELKEADDPRFAAEFEAAICKKMTFRCRAKMDSFGDTPRVRYQIMSAVPLDYKAEANKLVDLIKQMNTIPNNIFQRNKTIITHIKRISTGRFLQTIRTSHLPTIEASMDHVLSVLVDFPQDHILGDNDLYNSAVATHKKNLDKLVTSPDWNAIAPQVIDHVDPAKNSLSYIVLLNTLKTSPHLAPADILTKIAVFLVTFDARQIRYAGRHFTRLLTQPRIVDSFPPSIATDLIASALLRIDPTGSVLTNHHVDLVRFAYMSDNVEPVVPLIEKDIIFYPGAKPSLETRHLCDLELPPASYVTPDTELTAVPNSKDVLEYDLLRGLCFIELRRWRQAFDALERVITFPIKEAGSYSEIQIEAYSKWLLVGLLLNGKAPELPPSVGESVQRACLTLGKPYQLVAQAFETGPALRLKGEIEALPVQFWEQQKNFSLLRLVIEHHQRWQIIKLRNVFTKIPLERVRARTQSAETGEPLATVEEVETLIRGMINDKMLSGVIEHPTDGKPPYLEFTSPSEEISDAEFAQRMADTAARLVKLGEHVEATNERLANSEAYAKWRNLFQDQHKKGGEARGFDDTVLDEDLMTGILSEY
ncbi:hypothetical protein QBC35DRAFT_377489 [Podospora australis]|uniref:Replication protein A subunit n=1 Tax=Podospora australis TaxID=1536484 RepID=A0AAN6WYD5_9PEZI|nr:hypothetical protein QBC35DRAFT_377489 [Podospora australis]